MATYNRKSWDGKADKDATKNRTGRVATRGKTAKD